MEHGPTGRPARGAAATRAAASGAEPAPHAALSDGQFAEIAARVHALTGIVLPPHKRQMVISRLRKRLRSLGLGEVGAYMALLDSPAGAAETGELINVVTTNLTSFFRERHHFEDLGRRIADAARGGEIRRLRIWSAACSTGEEPYSIAMAAARALRGHSGCDLRILATDLNTEALDRAAAGLYPPERVETCPMEFRRAGFEPVSGGDFRVVPAIRSLITFNRLNLHVAWPFKGPFDAIFCRNVLIYFDAPDKHRIVGRFVELLKPGGTLYLGHSESMLGSHQELASHGHTIFRKSA